MADPEKIKSDNWGMIIFNLVCVIILVGSRIIFGEQMFYNMFWIIAAVFALIHFVALLRTKNWGHLIAMLFCLFLASTFFTLSFHPHHFLRLIFAGGALILFVLFMYVLFTKRIKWRYTEILELAAKPVKESNDGFTTRPYPAGEAKYNKEAITGFAKFMIKHVIAFPFFENNRVVLVVPENMFRYFLFFRRDYRKDTYLSFDFDGNVSVNIVKRDYQRFKEELTFDQLCDSLGNLFKEFLGLYQKGEKSKIIDRLNALRFLD
jgi:hypothetical protein